MKRNLKLIKGKRTLKQYIHNLYQRGQGNDFDWYLVSTLLLKYLEALARHEEKRCEHDGEEHSFELQNALFFIRERHFDNGLLSELPHYVSEYDNYVRGTL